MAQSTRRVSLQTSRMTRSMHSYHDTKSLCSKKPMVPNYVNSNDSLWNSRKVRVLSRKMCCVSSLVRTLHAHSTCQCFILMSIWAWLHAMQPFMTQRSQSVNTWKKSSSTGAIWVSAQLSVLNPLWSQMRYATSASGLTTSSEPFTKRLKPSERKTWGSPRVTSVDSVCSSTYWLVRSCKQLRCLC